MSTELNTKLDLGLVTKANPYLVCFCDERNECSCCKNDDYHTTGTVLNAVKKAGKAISKTVGEKGKSRMALLSAQARKDKMSDNHTKQQLFVDDAFNVFFKDIKERTKKKQLFSEENFKQFTHDWGLIPLELDRMSPDKFKANQGLTVLAHKMVKDAKSRAFSYKKSAMSYPEAMAALHKEWVDSGHKHYKDIDPIVQYGAATNNPPAHPHDSIISHLHHVNHEAPAHNQQPTAPAQQHAEHAQTKQSHWFGLHGPHPKQTAQPHGHASIISHLHHSNHEAPTHL